MSLRSAAADGRNGVEPSRSADRKALMNTTMVVVGSLVVEARGIGGGTPVFGSPSRSTPGALLPQSVEVLVGLAVAARNRRCRLRDGDVRGQVCGRG
jgi:hypothetical protein